MNDEARDLFPGLKKPDIITHGNKKETYEQFVEKFKPRKTTDDCYTPPAVYRAVLDFARERLGIGSRPVVRPFWPGGDYERSDYPPGCVVVDNPPFSIYAKIVRFYLTRGIDFLLFGPALTMFVKDADCAYLLTDSCITYENGAKVKTSFVTNLLHDLRIWLCPELKQKIEEAQKAETRILPKNTYPQHVVSSAILGKIIARNVELKIPKDQCVQVSNLDSLKKEGKSLFGSGYLISERMAAERMAAERMAAERMKGCTVILSDREMELVKSLR